MGQATNQHVSWYLQVQRIGADVWCDRDRSRVDIRLADGRQSLWAHLKHATHLRLLTFTIQQQWSGRMNLH